MTLRPPWLTRRVLWWALYDVAGSGYAALVPTLFPVFLTGFVLSESGRGEAVWGALASVSLIASGLLAPLFGAFADRTGRKLLLLSAATILCSLGCLAMPAVGPGAIVAAALLFLVAQIGYTLAIAIYDSFLRRLSTSETAGRISGFGWSVGFLGGIATICVSLALTDESSGPDSVAFILAIVGVIFLAIGMPAIAALRRIPELRSTPVEGRPPGVFAEVLRTICRWREQRALFRFLIAFYLINDVMVTVILFATIFLRDTFGVSLRGLLWLALTFHLVAAPSTLVWGWVADRIGRARSIHLTLLLWCGAILMMAFARGAWVPVAIVVVVASVLGSTQALFRAMLAGMVPAGNAGQWFGFHAVAGRLSAALGPLLFGAVTAFSGSQVPALLSLLPILALGAALLQRVGSR